MSDPVVPDLDLDEIEARAAAATPGPVWTVGDGAFIEYARWVIPRLVAEVKTLRERLADVCCDEFRAGRDVTSSAALAEARTELRRTEGDLGVAIREARTAREALQAVREIAVEMDRQIPTIGARAIVRLADAALDTRLSQETQ